MPSPGRVQLNLSIEPEIKQSLQKHCEATGLSFAQAITEYVQACDRQGGLIRTIPDTIPDVDLDRFVTKEQLDEALSSNSTEAIPSPSYEEIDDKIGRGISEAIAKIEDKIQPLLEAQNTLEQLERELEKLEA